MTHGKHGGAGTPKQISALLNRHGKTFAAELGIDLSRNRPSDLFRWLCAALLLSARISSRIAIEAAGALAREGWTTAHKLAGSSWEERVRVLNHAGYARYDEKTARMLGKAASMVLDEYDGDLRKLRQRAECDPAAERRLLKAFSGIGDVGADIFIREVQVLWPEHYPFADRKALEAARRLDLPDEAEGLAQMVDRQQYPVLLAALVRTALEKDFEDIRHAAAEVG